MFFGWLKKRKAQEALSRPFPGDWVGFLEKNMVSWAFLSEAEQDHLKKMVQVFVAEKHWEGCGGLEMSEEIQVTIAGQACLLILELTHDLYRRVQSILVYPATVVTPEESFDALAHGHSFTRSSVPILGQAFMRGPVVLVWDAVKRGGRDPKDGKNVVYHEFAHKLDMLDGSIDGTPVLDKGQYERWAKICSEAFNKLRLRAEAGKKSFLDDYGAIDEGEFFAVATEYFFERPKAMKRHESQLYDVLRDFYKQDPAARNRRR